MDWRRLVASCFGLGWLPVAPGTWGSAFPAGVFALLLCLNVSEAVVAAVMVVLVVVASLACVMFTPAVAATVGKSDPREIVVDEVAGQALTFLPACLVLDSRTQVSASLGIAILGFLLFRVFDILKPWPIRKLEALPAGWGVLADDLLAGVFAAVVLLICVKWWVIA
jgi:phosphatidylglycerophosphatase A